MKKVIDTLDPGRVYRFVKKPLNHIDIKQAVKAAIADYETKTGVKSHAII